ncbi:hypothetical protein [Actinoplanes sp. M2I2]|uniref:hypothetical protein n=1 Tax=Actinoplanes sp. M2I2 TaxID=1734444 RepID=UPI002021A4F3|nr:hypothetical protein [Actinoplanes sp. M2I2]
MRHPVRPTEALPAEPAPTGVRHAPAETATLVDDEIRDEPAAGPIPDDAAHRTSVHATHPARNHDTHPARDPADRAATAHPTTRPTPADHGGAPPRGRPRRKGTVGRALRGLVALGLLSVAAACGTAQSPGSSQTPGAAQPPGAAPAPGGAPASGAARGASGAPATGAIRTTCEALGRTYQANMAPLAESLTALVADRKTIAGAQKSLASFATAVQEATATSDDPDLKAAGKQAANQMHAKSTDAKFFDGIKTAKDVNKTLGPTLTGWLSPVTRHCS